MEREYIVEILHVPDSFDHSLSCVLRSKYISMLIFAIKSLKILIIVAIYSSHTSSSAEPGGFLFKKWLAKRCQKGQSYCVYAGPSNLTKNMKGRTRSISTPVLGVMFSGEAYQELLAVDIRFKAGSL